MQKLVTIYLDSYAYAQEAREQTLREKHGLIEEHLDEYLSEGWLIKNITSFGSAQTMYCSTGFVVVVLEKAD